MTPKIAALAPLGATLADTAVIIAREYLRVSKDRSGRAKSTTEQHDENEQHAEANGWQLGEPYKDDHRSASRHATREREDFERLVKDLRSGRFGAHILVLWESSRGSRKNSEWAEFLELLREQGVQVFVTSHGRLYDPRNARDMRSLQEDGIDSEYESEKISQRSRRSHAAALKAGLPSGRIPVGYVRIYDPVTRRLIAQVPDDSPEARQQVERLAERDDKGELVTPLPSPAAPWVRELFARLRQGHSLRSIALDFEARGIRRPDKEDEPGGPYSAEHLRILATRHTYAGLRVYCPERIHGNIRPGMKVEVTEGIWEGLVSREEFYAVQKILGNPERHRPGKAHHLLSMIAKCDVCSAPLSVPNGGDGELALYECRGTGTRRNGKHVAVRKAELDAFIEDGMLRLLESRDLADRIAARDDKSAALQALRDQIAELDNRLDALADNTTLSERVLERRTIALERDLKEARAQERELSTPSELRGLIEPGPGVRDRWAVAPISTKRRVARILLSPAWMGELRIKRAPFSGNQYRRPKIEDRVRWGSASD